MRACLTVIEVLKTVWRCTSPDAASSCEGKTFLVDMALCGCGMHIGLEFGLRDRHEQMFRMASQPVVTHCCGHLDLAGGLDIIGVIILHNTSVVDENHAVQKPPRSGPRVALYANGTSIPGSTGKPPRRATYHDT